nr:PREDICTED: dynein heavy chain domain-containing protein 1 [Lepisosteus oculatus]
MRNRHLGKLQFLHLNIASTCPYRPYDLHVVQKSKANPEHYVFSPSSVLHVQPNHSSDLTPLRDWHRESILWSALQKIPFFRNFLIRKTFTCWHRNVRQLRLHKRCESLQRFLLIAIPQFREALLQLSRLIEELKRVHWLPQDASQSYTLMEFQSTLCRKHQEARGLLEQFLHYRTLILLMVQEDSYRVFQKLQTQLEHFRLGLGREPLYLQVAQHRALEQNLEQAECVLQRLGSLASLTGHMIVHTMVTIIEREVTSFVNDVMKSGQPGRVSLFQAQLVFGTESQLTLFPPVTLFEETLSGALQSVANSALQVFDSFSYTEDIKGFLAASNSTVCAPRGPQEWSTSRGLGDTENELKDISPLKFPPKLDCGAAPDPGLVLSTLGPLRVRGQRLKAQYYPLSRCQLEWHLSLNPEVQEAEREQERMIKKALSEVQQFCKEHSWLSDIHHFISLWSPKCLEGLRGCTASQYDERIQVIRGWTDKVKTVPQKFTTTNKIMTVECIDVQKIEPVLCSIHGDILSLLTSEVEQRSETWMLELKRAVGTLRVANADFSAFAQYVSMVKCYQKMFYDLQQQLDYVHSLQETIRTNYRQLSKAEESMDEQMLDLWDSFVPLLQVATETVSTRLPSMVETLNSIYTSLSEELQGLVSTATTGQYLQPSQCAAVVLEELKGIAQQFQTVAGKLYDLNRTSQSLTGSPLDLSFIPSTERKLEARKGVWELLSQATMQINEWKRILFSKFVVAHAQEKVNDWLNQASLLVQTLPAQDNVFKETMQLIENFSQQLPLLLKLSSPTLKHKHWRHIFKGLGLMYETEWHLTVADLLPKSLLEYQNSITKVWQDAKAEADMEQAFRKLQRRWNVEHFRLANFIVKVWQEDPPPDRSKRPPSGRLHDVTRKQHYQDSGTFTIIGFENLLALAEDSVMTLSNMMLSPHISEFRQEVENWVHLLQELEELLGFWQRYQQEWVFLSKIFYETEVSIQKPELGTETDEIAILSSAVTQELQEIGLHSDQWTIKNVLSLYEALKLSRAVILVGPAGSGKTACYRTLVGALRKLAVKTEEEDYNEECMQSPESVTLKSKWSSVDTMVIFPNSVSEEEFSGICNHDEQHGGWWRAFTKILKDSERRDFSTRERQKSQTHKGKWVVLDGEPLAEGWMDQLSTLFDLEDPYLCFSSGQKVRPSPEQVKLLMEVTELASASPSTVTRCGIVYHSGKEVWKAIWKAELETLYREFSLDQTTLRLWNRLAEDLFSSTLSFLKHKALSPVLLEGSILSADKTTAHGVQEVMSFTRILHSFLEQYLIGKGKALLAGPRNINKTAESPSTTKLEDPGNLLSQKHLQAKNIFVVSYVWGFGGHLHPKYWLRFDAFARKSLYESWYSIEIPQEGTVYDYLINQNEGTLEMMNTGLLNSRIKTPPLSYSIPPQFEKYAYLLDVLLDSRQPALLVGETGAGKTTLSQSLLNYERPHVRLPITPCLRAADVRNVLENMWSPRAKLSAAGLSPAGSKQSCLFIDDLHHTTCDVGSKISSVLETLRQCMSKGGVLTSDGYHFKLLNSGAVSYLATCVSPECCSSMTICISPRFFRLFSVLTLPSLVTEHLLSIHSPRVLHWLKDLHITAVSQYTELASCIIGATVDLYSAVKENFPPHQQQPYLLFSYHDLQKVFQGMFLWTPRTTARQYPQGKTSSLGTDSALGFANISSTHGSLAAVLNITRLWIHECFRTFGDRLSSENEKRVLASLLNKVSQKYFCPKESDSQKTKGENESCAMPSENNQNSEKSEIILPLPDKDDQSEDIISSDSETCQVQSEGTVGDLTSVELPASSLKTETEEFVYSSEEESSASTITPIEPLESNLEICSDEDVKKIPAETCDKDNINTSSRDDERKSLYLKESFAKSLMTTTKSTFSDSVQSLILQPSPPKQGKHPRTADKNIKRRDNLGIYFKLSIVNEVPNQKITSFLLPIQLLQGVDAKDIIFSTNFCESLQSPTQQYSLKRSSVYQEKDMDLLIQQLSSLLQWQCREEMIDKGFVSGPESKLAIFRERVQQLTHILRVLLLPRGHAALFGMGKGTGRKTLVRFAVSFSGYRLYDVNPNNETEVSEILKEASDHAGVFGGRVVILVHEEVSQSVLDKLLAVMAEGTFPGLYNKDELSAAVQKITALTKNTKNRLGEEQVLERYYKHVQKNLHVFIMLSPKCQKHAEPLKEKMLSEIFLSRLLKLCSCVEMFQPLSAETLSEVAASRLQDVILPPEEEGKGEEACSLEVLTKSMATIHQSVLRYVTHQVPGLHLFSLQVFLEFTEHFRDIFTHLWQQARAQANRVATILRRLKILTNTAKQSSQEVLFVRNELKVAQELQQQLQREVDAQRILCEQTRQRCLQEENILSDLSEQLQQAQHESQEAFQQPIPGPQVSSLYQAALDALHSLTVADIEEIRCYRVPPDGVVMVMNAVCLMFGRPRNWESSKQLIGQTSFFQDLEFYDKSGITDSLFTALGRIVVQPEFQPAVVREASRACESLCLWLHSIYQYASVQRHLAPQHNRVHQVEEHMVKSRIRLGQERVQEEAARECLEELEKQYQGASQHVGELTLQLRHADAREREAHSAAQLMHSHITNWTAAAKKATEDNHNAVGDALVLAAAASYLGPFNPDVRLEMLEKWQELCHTGEMQLNPRDQRHEVLPTTVPPVPRNIVLIPVSKELPLSKALGGCVSASETFSHRPVLQLVIRRSRCPFVQRWPLLVGSAQQAKSCAEAILEEHLSHLDLESSSQPDTWMVLCADDPTLVEKIQKGAERGLVVLVTDVERVVLSPKLLDFLQRKPEKWASGLRTDSMAAHHHFTLFLSTHLPVRALAQELDSNILKVVNVIDISLSQSELEELLLKELVLSECPEVWGQRRTVQMEKLQIVNRMQEVEDSLVEYILQSLTPLLEDPCFLSHVSECQKTMSVLHQDLKEVSVELQHHCVLLKDFDGVVKLGSALYQALQEVSRLSPLYFFPLQPFLQLFKVALGHNGRTEGANGGEFTSATMAEITHRIVSDVLSHYRPCLFQSHARFFQLLVSVALIRHNDECTSLEQQIFLKGLKDVVSSLDLHSTSTHLVKWVDEHTMREICYLENLTAFKGLSSSLLHLSEQWQEYFKFPSSTVIGPVPCSSYAQLSTLQKAVLWKTLHPEWLFAVAEDLAYTQLGQTLASVDYATTEISSQLLNLPAIPVIFLLPQKGDLGPSTHPLYWIEQAVKTQANQVRIHVISFGSHCQRESTLHTLDTCTRGGHWLVFNNCHLLDQWDSELVSQLSKLFSQTARGKPVDPWKEDADDAAPAAPLACGERPIHPQFRLWFITRSDAPQSIPAAVKACALRLACDSPWELKETLCSSLRQAAAGPCPPADLQIRCAVLHSVLLQRQNYRQIAQGHLHCWTQEDLLAVLNAWEKIERLCEDPVQALEFIAGRNVYQRLRKLNLVCQVDKYSFTRLW